MATKSEVQKRRTALKQFVREAITNGKLLPGQILPPVRELAEQHQLSLSVVNQALQEFAEEGLLYTVPRVGTFVGQPQTHSSEFYLLLIPYHPEDEHKQMRLRLGFQERITQLGAASIVMQPEQALEHRAKNELPVLAGVFNYGYDPESALNWLADSVLPNVGFASWTEDKHFFDLVSFDDVDGGRQATQYLISLGHRRIAFLAFHTAVMDQGLHLWSAEREEGWRQALTSAGLPPIGLTFHMETLLPLRALIPDQIAAAQSVSRALIRRPDITAVVTANDHLAVGLFAALRAANVPPEYWPAVVSFDNSTYASDHQITSFDLPWDDLGRTAADLLWQRQHGRLTGPPHHRRVPMRLIRRMTSQAGWSVMAQAIIVVAAEPATLDDEGTGNAT